MNVCFCWLMWSCFHTSPGSEDHVSNVDHITQEVHDKPEHQVVSLKFLKARPTHASTYTQTQKHPSVIPPYPIKRFS